MKNVPMRYAGLPFLHNPSKLTIEDKANIMSLISPCAPPDSLRLGRGLRTVRGEGELYGADCLEQYRRLAALCEREEKGILSLPKLPPMTAYLKELRLTAEPHEDLVSFSFTFIEALGEQSAVTADSVYTVVSDGESLWDVAYLHGLSIDRAVELNPHIRYIASHSAGEKVRLC